MSEADPRCIELGLNLIQVVDIILISFDKVQGVPSRVRKRPWWKRLLVVHRTPSFGNLASTIRAAPGELADCLEGRMSTGDSERACYRVWLRILAVIEANG